MTIIRSTILWLWTSPGYPIDGNRWSEIQSVNRYQSIKLVNWHRLISANRWPIDNHTKAVHRLLSIGTATSNRRRARYLSDHLPFLGSPWDETGKTNSDPVFSTQRIYPVARVLELPTCPSLPFRVIMSTQDIRVEAFLNIRCIVKGYHLCCFEVNVGEVLTANKKRGERGNALKVVNHRGQLGHPQSELVNPLWSLHTDISVLFSC